MKYQRNVNDVLLLTLKTTFRFRQNLETFIAIVSNNYLRISGKMVKPTIEEKAFLLEYYFRNGVNRQPIKLCIASTIQSRQTFR
jgi:hypothetical protein